MVGRGEPEAVLEVYGFRPRGPVVAGWEVLGWASACGPGGGRGEATINLGRGRVREVWCEGATVCADVGRVVCVDPSGVRPDRVYTLPDMRPVEAFGERGYVKLRALGPGRSSTLEINGIHMHRIEGVDPLEDAEAKVELARVRRGHLVLDVCTGLGYTAIAARRRGARVVTVEVDELVLWAAERNPFSSGLADPGVTIVLGDAVEVVQLFEDATFDRVIHDPPRYSVAGELYSRSFYAELFRVLKPGGVLYHYTGEPGRHSNVDVVRGVVRRLREVGFESVRFVPEVLGVVARKPRL